MNSTEQIKWINWSDAPDIGPTQRIYLGEETCIDRLPGDSAILDAVSAIVECRSHLTLVLPFVPESFIERVDRLLERIAKIAGVFELVCNDWGVLRIACKQRGCVPVVGRILNRQDCDPRMIYIYDSLYQAQQQHGIRRVEGNLCRLRYQPPPPDLLRHYRQCSLDRQQVYRHLEPMGIRRLELSNLWQGIELSPPPNWRVTLHVPWVLVTMSRFCPGEGENYEDRQGGCPGNCHRQKTKWIGPSFPCPLYRFGNALYYHHADLPTVPEKWCVDRIVHRDTMIPH